MEEEHESFGEFVAPAAKLVPEAFWSAVTDKPFSNCIVCQKKLADMPYSVTKVIRQYREYKVNDTIIEAAMCMNCSIEMQKEVSEESAKVMGAFQHRLNGTMEKRAAQWAEDREVNRNLKAEHYLQECVLSGKKREEMDEYHIISVFRMFHQMPLPPLLVSGEIMNELQEQLSSETLGLFERFNSEHFGIPPEWQKSPTGPVIFM